MHTKLTTSLDFFTSDEPFSLDELVLRLKNLFESHAYCSVLHAFLDLLQRSLVARAAVGRLSGHEGRWYAKDGTYRKIFRTSLGEFEMKMVRLKDPETGGKLCPLRDFLGLRRYQTKSSELEKEVVEAVSSDSYRESHDLLVHTSSLGVTHQTMHNWLLKTGCDEIDVPRGIADAAPLQVLPDGTGCKGPGRGGKAVSGDLKIAIGVNTSGHVFPLGSWAGASWKEIAEEWKRQKVKFPDGSILVSDGEPGLSEAFAGLIPERQRCQWHAVRDLYHMMHADGGLARESRPYQDRLAALMAIELPKEDFARVDDEEKKRIAELMNSSEAGVARLIAELQAKGYDVAVNCLARAAKSMFGYVRRWLRTGLIGYRASSMVERVMRAIGRRIKKIAYGWKEKGVCKMAKILLKRFADEAEWKNYWERLFFATNPRVAVTFEITGVTNSSHNF